MNGNFGISDNEVRANAGEDVVDIPQNRTLIMEHLTPTAPLRPQIAQGLQTVAQVFEHYKPAVDITFEDAEGKRTNEKITFSAITDFSVKSITDKSGFLTSLTLQQDEYMAIIRQLKSNKMLGAALNDPGTRKAFLDTIYGLMAELKNNQ